MTLPEFSIQRHVFTLMISLVMILYGIIGLQRLGIDKFPEIEFPAIAVITTLRGADPEIVDKNITDVIEEAVNQVPGVKSITSNSSLGASVIGVEFELEKDIDVAYQEAKAKIDGVVNLLPDDTDPPVVRKIEVGATAVLWLAVQGNRSLQQLNTYADEVIKPRLETINGVGQVLIGGELKRTIRIWLDNERLHAFDLSGTDILKAFGKEHIVLPGGFLGSKSQELLVKLDAEFNSIKSMRKLIVAYRQGAPVYLEDVANIEDGLEDLRKIARYNGESTVGLGIVKTSGANTVALVDQIRERVEKEINPRLPAGMKISFASDNSLSIRDSIAALGEHLILGTLFAALMVFLFLKSFRSTMIIATAIPVSLMATFALMYFAGFTLNKITLLGMLLLIGVVVDDAIVVLENIFRHQEEGHEDRMLAAKAGSNQVVFAVLASTLTLVSIFLPVVFISGILGKFLSSFAVVVVVGVLASLWVSLTLTPMLCARYLSIPTQHGRLYRRVETALKAMDNTYRRLLEFAITRRWTIILISLLVVMSSSMVFKLVGKTFIPQEDESQFIIRFETPLGSNYHYTNRKLGELERLVGNYPEIRGYFSAIGLGAVGQVNAGIIFVTMHPKLQRNRSQSAVMQQLRIELNAIPGVTAFPSVLSPIGGQRGEPLQFAITGPDVAVIDQLSDKMVDKLSEISGIAKLDKGLELNLPQVQLILDRERAAQLGISAQDIAQTLSIMTGGLDVADFKDRSQRYKIRLQIKDDKRKNIDDLKKIYIKNKDKELIRLDSLVKFEKDLGPAVISRRNRSYAGFIYGDLEGLPLGDATSAVKRIAAEILPADYGIAFTGQAEEFAKTGGYVVFAFGMALIMVYMVLASQFNHFIQPLLVMTAQPLAIIGGVTALWLFGETLNVFSMIGMILLMGLVAKNAILLVDLTNQFRDEGMDIQTALREACPRRLRPVLITSLTVIAAMLPAAFGVGPGVETNRPLALVIIGGMVSSTLLTLVVVPSAYSLVEGWLSRHHKPHQGGES